MIHCRRAVLSSSLRSIHHFLACRTSSALLHRTLMSSNETMSSKSNNRHIQKKIVECEEQFQSRACPAPDSPATATLLEKDGFLCKVTNPSDSSRTPIYTDMPEGIGGKGTSECNSPGWHLRAAMAACDVSMIQIRASRLNLELTSVEVSVEGSSDGRGMLGTGDDTVSPASTAMKITYKVGIEGTSTTPQQIKDVIEWVEQHSPVATDVKDGVQNRLTSQIKLV